MTTHRTYPKIPGFRLGIYVFKDAEIVDYAAPYGVLSVARRFDPELDAFLIADAMRAVQTQAGFTVLPNSTGRTWTRFSSPAASERGRKCTTGCCMSSSGRCRKDAAHEVCTGMDLRRHGAARRQTHNQPQGADRLEASKFGKVPIDRPAEIAPKARISRARVVDAGRIITAGGIASGMEWDFICSAAQGSTRR